MANEFIIKNGFRSQGDSQITGSINVIGGAAIILSNNDGYLQVGNNNGGFIVENYNRTDVKLKANAIMTSRGTGITFRTTVGEPINNVPLAVIGSGATSGTTSFLIQNSNASSSLTVLDNGYIGMGTSTPTERFVIDGDGVNINDQTNLLFNSRATLSTGYSSIIFKNTNTATTIAEIKATVGSGYTNNTLGFFSQGTERMRIFGATGNITIGTTTDAGFKLDVNGTARVSGLITSTGVVNPGSSVTLEQYIRSNTGQIYIQTNGAIDLLGLTLTNAIFRSAQNVLIGTTTPTSHKLTVSGSAGTGSAIYAYKSGSTVLDIQGSQGQLFSVIDALSGSLMSVNDVSGLPILEVFSDDRVVMGTYGAPALIVTGSNTIISGSLRGRVASLSIASNTASIDLSSNNFFTITLVNGANTYINPTNIQPGQTVNVRVTQGSAGTGTVSFPSFVDQASGSLYTGSAVANAIDIITMITFDSSIVYVSSIRNLI